MNLARGQITLELDGNRQIGAEMTLTDDGKDHFVVVTVGPIQPEAPARRAYSVQSVR
jgi:hypothetical protein